MPGEVIVTCQTNKQFYPVLPTQQLAYVLIDIQPSQALANVQAPLNFSLVLDRSGSMSGEKIRNLREAVKLAIDQMTPQDFVSIISFHERADVIVSSQAVNNPGDLKKKVDKIDAGGGTSISAGMKLGLQELLKKTGSDRVSRMLLLTDGQTFGDEKKCIEMGAAAGKDGISVSALGLGDDWNNKLLDQIATNSGPGGVSDLIERPDEILATFQHTVRAMQGTVVTNAMLTLRLIQGAMPRQVWQVLPLISNLGHRPISDRDVQVTLGGIDKNTGKQLLVELLVPPRQAGNFRIAQAEVSYDFPPRQLTYQRERADIVLGFSADQALTYPVDPTVMNIVEKVTAFRLQTQALQDVDAGNIQGATTKLRQAATRLLNMGEDDLATTFLQEADTLETTLRLTDSGTK
ncbi:MAG: VWA domain-containing protein, partial [Anaerolineae bacterium]|nr:VWA domain-containing protein [Anaerolineae bacterium]